MCGPTAAIILGLGGALLRGVGSVMQGNAAYRAGIDDSEAALLHAEIARNNTRLLIENAATGEKYAKLAGQRGAAEEGRVRSEVGRITRSQAAGFSAAGVDPTRGSPLVLAARSVAQGETDALLVRTQGMHDAAVILADAAGKASQAYSSALSEKGYVDASVNALRKARQARIAGWFGAGTALLQGASSIIQERAAA